MGQFMHNCGGGTPLPHSKRVLGDNQIIRMGRRHGPAPEVTVIRRIVVDPDLMVVEEIFEAPATWQGFEFIVSGLLVAHFLEQDRERATDRAQILVRNEGRTGGVYMSVGAIAYAEHGSSPAAEGGEPT